MLCTAAGRADDLGLAAGGRGLGAELEQQGRGAAVEGREPRYVELETGGGGREQAPHLVPGLEAARKRSSPTKRKAEWSPARSIRST